MLEQSPSSVAVSWMWAVVTGDLDTAIRLSSPSIIYTNSHVRRYEGHQGVRDIVSDLSRLSGFVTNVVDGDVLEDGVVVALRRVQRFTLPSGGIEVRACSFVEVEDGVVTRWADYQNLEAIDVVVG